jgi:tetratricopeptide (TPR) repeat protein
MWHTLYARAAEASGEIRYALESMEIALELWSEEPRWHAQAARLAEMMGMMDDAVTHWEKALELSGEDLSLAYDLGTAYLANGESTKAIQMLQVVCEKRPDRLEAWTSLSEAYMQANLLEDALECVRKASNLDGEDTRPLIQAGKVYLAMGAPAEALEMARQARERTAQPEQAILLQSKSLAALEDDKAAIRVLEEALVDLPDSETLQLERVRRIQATEGSLKVKPILADLSIQFPTNAEVFSLLSKAQIETGDPDGAEQSAVASLRLNPDQSDLHLLLGFIDRKAGNLDQAVHHFTQAIELAPDDVEGYLELGKAHEMRREQSEAVYAFQQAMAVAPDDHRPYYLAALALRDGKDYRNAEKLLRQAAELAPNDLNIRRQLGAVIALNLVHHSQEANSCL